MLVIRRRVGQSLWVGNHVQIEIVEIAANRVTLGITAPREVSVLRDEIRLTGESNQAAARAFSSPGLAALIERYRGGTQNRVESDKKLPQ